MNMTELSGHDTRKLCFENKKEPRSIIPGFFLLLNQPTDTSACFS